jgi:hypothetical protein
MLLLLVVVVLPEHIYRNLSVANTLGLFNLGPVGAGQCRATTRFCCWFKPLVDRGILLPGWGLNW